MAINKLTQARLKELMDYNPETGKLTWLQKPHRNSSIKTGDPVGSVNGQNYLQSRIDGKWYRVHRLCWFWVHDEWPEVVDHVNGNRLDNRLENLRATNVKGNNHNYQKHRDGVPANVSKRKDGKYEAYISASSSPTGKKIHIGLFKSKKKAELMADYIVATIEYDLLREQIGDDNSIGTNQYRQELLEQLLAAKRLADNLPDLTDEEMSNSIITEGY